jgi:hypothetical protein
MIFFLNVLTSVLFLAKLLWTAAIPIAMKIEIQNSPIEERERAGKRCVSLALVIDVVLLLALISISAVTGQGIFHLSPFLLFVVGVGAIVLSIACCIVALTAIRVPGLSIRLG